MLAFVLTRLANAFLVMLVVAVPLPTLADETSKPAPVPGLSASIAKAAASGKAALSQAPQAKPAPDKAELGSTSFFKKPIGIAVLAVVGVRELGAGPVLLIRSGGGREGETITLNGEKLPGTLIPADKLAAENTVVVELG